MLVQLDVESVSRMPSEAGNAFHTFITTLTYTQPVFLVEHVQSGLYLGGTLTALPAVWAELCARQVFPNVPLAHFHLESFF